MSQISNLWRRVEASHSYGFVMFFVVATIVLAVAIPDDSRWRASIVICQAISAVVACWTSDAPKRLFQLVLAFSTVSILAAIGFGVFGQVGSTAGRTVNVIGVLVVGAVIVRGIVIDIQAEGVRGRAVAGALTIYLLFGTLCGFIYRLEESLSSDPVLHAANPSITDDGSTSANMYFSFVTLTTVGYGDLTPISGAARATAIFEALVGQLYLVGIVATLGGALGKGKGKL
ncbi:MAG: potassium channel family protein [Actinomycetes bacterium]